MTVMGCWAMPVPTGPPQSPSGALAPPGGTQSTQVPTTIAAATAAPNAPIPAAATTYVATPVYVLVQPALSTAAQAVATQPIAQPAVATQPATAAALTAQPAAAQTAVSAGGALAAPASVDVMSVPNPAAPEFAGLNTTGVANTSTGGIAPIATGAGSAGSTGAATGAATTALGGPPADATAGAHSCGCGTSHKKTSSGALGAPRRRTARRTRRLASARASDPNSPLRQRVLGLARGEVGVRETSTNNSARIAQYRASVTGNGSAADAWCAYFVSWLFNQAGAPVVDGNGDGAVSAIKAWGQRTGRYHDRGFTPTPGDMIVFHGAGDKGHIGVVDSVDADGTIHTIEGNTGTGSGEGVGTHTYAPSSGDIVGFVSAE